MRFVAAMVYAGYGVITNRVLSKTRDPLESLRGILVG